MGFEGFRQKERLGYFLREGKIVTIDVKWDEVDIREQLGRGVIGVDIFLQGFVRN